MPIPEPTTPKDSSVSCHDNGPKLETPDLKSYSLSDGKKNEVMFFKSRSGNLISMYDAADKPGDRSLRLQDKSGNAEIRMTDNVIEIKQKSGDINFSSEKETRYDCTEFLVHAKKDISFSAGEDITLIAVNMITKSKKDTSFTADKNITWISWNTFKAQAAQGITITGKKKVSVATKQKNMTFMAGKGFAVSSKQDLSLLSKATLTAMALMGLDFKSSDKITLLASGPFIGMSMCININ